MLAELRDRMQRQQRPRHGSADKNKIVAIARIVADHVPHFRDGLIRRPVNHHAHRTLLGVMYHQHDRLRKIGIAQIARGDQEMPGEVFISHGFKQPAI
jgi:hypothetical protein